jgi:flagellar basal body-associated protein FliL
MSEKTKIVIYVFFVFMISVAAVVVYQSKDKINLKKIFYGNQTGISKRVSGGSNPIVQCVVITSIEKKTLRLTVNIPCQNRRQKTDLEEKLPKIKNAFIMSISDASMQELIKDRDFNPIKIRFLSIINTYTSIHVSNLYFEHYFLG